MKFKNGLSNLSTDALKYKFQFVGIIEQQVKEFEKSLIICIRMGLVHIEQKIATAELSRGFLRDTSNNIENLIKAL